MELGEKQWTQIRKIFQDAFKRLWSKLKYVREIHFDAYEPIRIGALTHGLGKE